MVGRFRGLRARLAWPAFGSFCSGSPEPESAHNGDEGGMAAPRSIALDAMGGDAGPAVVVPGAAIALERHGDISVLLFGDEPRIRAHLGRHPRLADRARIVHTDTVVE